MYCCPILMLSLQRMLSHFSILKTLRSPLVHVGICILWFAQGSLTLRGNTWRPMLFTNLNAIPVKGITLVIRGMFHLKKNCTKNCVANYKNCWFIFLYKKKRRVKIKFEHTRRENFITGVILIKLTVTPSILLFIPILNLAPNSSYKITGIYIQFDVIKNSSCVL